MMMLNKGGTSSSPTKKYNDLEDPPRPRSRSRAASETMKLLKLKFQSLFPPFLLIPSVILYCASVLNILIGYTYTWYKNNQFSTEILPENLKDGNFRPNLIFDILLGCVGETCIVLTGLVLLWFGALLFNLLPTIYIPVDVAKMIGHRSFKQRRRLFVCVFVWMITLNWYFNRGVMTAFADMNLQGRGGMFMFETVPSFMYPVERWSKPEELSCEREEGGGENHCADMRIERIIHQTYKTTDLPEDWKDTPRHWQEAHPDWEYKFWTDKSARDFIEKEYPWFLESFDSYIHPIQRADAIRYFALYHFGGIYADMDLQPKINVEKVFAGADVVSFETPNMGLTNMMFGARKHSDILGCTIAQLGVRKYQFHHTLAPFRGWQILSSTGPTFWWAMNTPGVCNHMTEKLRIISANLMGRCNLCEGDISKCSRDGFMYHLTGSTWHNNDVHFTHLLYCQPCVVFTTIGLCIRVAKVAIKFRHPSSTQRKSAVVMGNVEAIALILFSLVLVVWLNRAL